VVDDVCQIIVACEVVIETNDKQQAVPMAEMALGNLQAAGIERPVDAAGEVQKIISLQDSGYFSEKAMSGLEGLGLDPYMAIERQKHHAEVAVPVSERATLTAAVEAQLKAGASAKEQSAKEQMRAKM